MGYIKIKRYLRTVCALPGRPGLLLSNQHGLTLIELLLVMAILAALAGIAIPAYSNMKDNARSARAMSELREIDKVIYAFSIDNAGRYPDHLSDLNMGNMKDPWGNDYEYYNIVVRGTGGARVDKFSTPLNLDFDLYSKGADLDTNLDITVGVSQDDIVRAGDGGFMGLGKVYMPSD